MPVSTKVTKQDLQIYKSERLTDTPDGGGLMTNKPLTGEKNELFNPVSDVSRVNGGFEMRKIFPAVLREDDEPIFGAHFILSGIPTTPNWSFLVFKALNEAEERKSAVGRIANFYIKTVKSRMIMLGTQAKDSRIFQAYQDVDVELPNINDTYCLDQKKTGYKTVEQYVRIRNVTGEIRTFVENGVEFKKKVVTVEVDSKLEESFVGIDYPVKGNANPPCAIKETHISDSASYYGIKKIEQDVAATDLKIKVSSIYEKIIPTSTSETPLNNLNAGGISTAFFDAAKPNDAGVVEYETYESFSPSVVFYTGSPITPGSLSITLTNGVKMTDDNGQLRTDAGVIGTVNYGRGFIKLADGGATYAGQKIVKFRPAGAPTKISNSISIPVEPANRRRNYVITINPAPGKGSVTASYRAQGRWYDLVDKGNGVLQGASESYGGGAVNYSTKTVTLSLGQIPDANTAIIISYGSPATYINRSESTVNAPVIDIKLAKDNAAPGTVQLEYSVGGTAKTFTDDSNGKITGDGLTAEVDYANARVLIKPTTLPAGGAQYKFTYSSGAKQERTFTSSNRVNNKVILDLGATNIAPKSVYLSTTLTNYTNPDRKSDYVDDGNGKMKSLGGTEVGTINYTDGKIVIDPDLELPLGITVDRVYNNGHQLDYTSVWQYLNQAYRYINADIKVKFHAGSLSSSTETISTSGLQTDLTNLYQEQIVAGSASFKMGGETYYEKDGKLYYKLNVATGQGIEAGTVNLQTGEINITTWNVGSPVNFGLISLLTTLDKKPVVNIAFRVPSSPLAPSSFQLLGNHIDGTSFNVTAAANGEVKSATVEGKIDVETGVFTGRFGSMVNASGNESEPWYSADAVVNGKIFKPNAVFAETLKYNAVAYNYIPLDNEIIKVDSARLPSDGLVPIYRKGDTVVIGSRHEQDLGSSFTANQVVQLNKTGLTALCLMDSKNKHVTIDKYDVDLATGKITFKSPLDLSAYTMPLIARFAIEVENRVTDVDIDGTLTMQNAIGKTFDKSTSFVSSALIGGDMQVRSTKPFSQASWDSVWSDELRGTEILAKLDTRNYPIVLTDDGTMTERWLIKFTSDKQLELYGETVGLVSKTDILTPLAPNNPATGKPYFTIPKEAFGDGTNSAWASGNCIRFNTYGTALPAWIVRIIQPSADSQINDDGFSVEYRANTTKS